MEKQLLALFAQCYQVIFILAICINGSYSFTDEFKRIKEKAIDAGNYKTGFNFTVIIAWTIFCMCSVVKQW